MRSIGWALFRVNFRPLQKIEAIMEGGWTFDTGPFFARLQYLPHIKVHTYTNCASPFHLKQQEGWLLP